MARFGTPIRYGYLDRPLPSLDAFQTIFARVPGSAEMPSAGRPFTARLVGRLIAKGISIHAVTLHTGVSSLETEADDLEYQAFYPEPFRVTAETAAAINAARRCRRPVVAVGTTVVRALASATTGDGVRPARGFTRRVVRPRRPAIVVDGLVTGLHDAKGSHIALLEALAGKAMVADGYDAAATAGYLWHEFGDSHLILPKAKRPSDQ
jgi:S-adenosylmethionine:tRNA ribosyltransferase-isomerase